MRVVQRGQRAGLDHLREVVMEAPKAPGRGEMLVRIHASSLNYHDYNVAMGHLPVEPGRILLSDGAGVVEAVGEGVTEFAVGDAVVSCFFPQWLDGPPTVPDFSTTPGDGVDGYAREYVVRPAHWFTRSPRHLNHVQSATITTAGLTAWRALVVDGGLKAGETVLVLGSGGVSIFALQIAKAVGATVIATSSSNAKLERMRELGADHVINYKEYPAWAEKVLAHTGRQGVDHVIEVGGPATLPQSIAACRVGGHIAFIGILTGISGEVPTLSLLTRQVRLQGLIVGSRRHQHEFVRAMEAVKLVPVLDRSFELGALAEALRYEESGAHFGKIGITV